MFLLILASSAALIRRTLKAFPTMAMLLVLDSSLAPFQKLCLVMVDGVAHPERPFEALGRAVRVDL